MGRILLEGSYCRLGPIVESGRHPAWPVLRTDILHGLKKKRSCGNPRKFNWLSGGGVVIVLEIRLKPLGREMKLGSFKQKKSEERR
jgi:hypothetical protein